MMVNKTEIKQVLNKIRKVVNENKLSHYTKTDLLDKLNDIYDDLMED